MTGHNLESCGSLLKGPWLRQRGAAQLVRSLRLDLPADRIFGSRVGADAAGLGRAVGGSRGEGRDGRGIGLAPALAWYASRFAGSGPGGDGCPGLRRRGLSGPFHGGGGWIVLVAPARWGIAARAGVALGSALAITAGAAWFDAPTSLALADFVGLIDGAERHAEHVDVQRVLANSAVEGWPKPSTASTSRRWPEQDTASTATCGRPM